MFFAAIGFVVNNKAEAKLGMQPASKYWNTQAQECQDCTLTTPGVCSTTPTPTPCMCISSSGPSQARILSGSNPDPQDNCVALFLQPNP